MKKKQADTNNFENLATMFCERFNEPQERFYELFHESGCLYLEDRLPPPDASRWSEQKMFWTWWRSQFSIIVFAAIRKNNSIAQAKKQLRTTTAYPGKHILTHISKNIYSL